MGDVLDLRRTYARDLDPTACVEQGGHCWERDPMVTLGTVPTYTDYCRHCPAYRKGRPQEDINWSEPMTP